MRVKLIWALLFRLFPCPTAIGLRKVGRPGPHSPVLLTGNFLLTVERLSRVLIKANIDAWLLKADSKGVNVWCAAGAGELNTRSVVAALKTSGLGQVVARRQVILPPLCAPGVQAARVQRQSGWRVRWGPMRAAELPEYLANNRRRSPAMKRATYIWRERLDTALGALFPFWFLAALAMAALAPGLLWRFVWVSAACFVAFFSALPLLPGKRGLGKALFCSAICGAALLVCELASGPGGCPARTLLIIAMAAFLLYGAELGGLASTMASDLDPVLARLGLARIGKAQFAGTQRTELLLGRLKLTYFVDRCIGCRQCWQVCPQGVWEPGPESRAAFARPGDCTSCRACLVQCPSQAIEALPADAGAPAH